jgi:hypothetical protein
VAAGLSLAFVARMYRVYRQIVERSTVFRKYFGKLSKNVRECKNPADGGIWWDMPGYAGICRDMVGYAGIWWDRGAHEKTPVVAGVCVGLVAVSGCKFFAAFSHSLTLTISQFPLYKLQANNRKSAIVWTVLTFSNVRFRSFSNTR